MAERTPEEINRIVEGINTVLPHGEYPDDKQLLQRAIDAPMLIEELRSGIRSALRMARWQGVLEGIQYARGEGELPDIEDELKTIEVMRKYLSPGGMQELLGPVSEHTDDPFLKGVC